QRLAGGLMPLPSVDDFRERFPEFETTSDEAIELAIDDAGDEISEEIWMEKDYSNGVLFLAAHFLVAGTTQAGATTEGGYVRSESIGRISTSYGDQVMSASNVT